MSEIDKSKFVGAMKVARHAKASLDAQGNPTRWNSRPWNPNQIVLETDKFVFVSRMAVAPGQEIPRMVETERGWTLMEEYASRLTSRPNKLKPRGFAQYGLWGSEELDRGLQVACDMGRWDIAFMMVVKTWGLGEIAPNEVLWDSFPHTSTMSVVSQGRLFIPSGLTKQVIENWWAWQGGYHSPKATLWTDWDEYEAVMRGLRNPFKLGGVPDDIGVVRLSRTERPLGVVPPALTPGDLSGREWWYGAGVAYIANHTGTVLPYWYVSAADGSRGNVEELAWGSGVRNNLSRQMNLPVLIARQSSAF